MPNGWIKQACVKGFDCETVTKNKTLNMFESMEIMKIFIKG